MNDDIKRRLKIFGVGLAIGLMLSMVLLTFAQHREREEVEQIEVVLTNCDLAPGDVLEESCVETLTVAYSRLPPKPLRARDLDWHLGKKVVTRLEAGSVLRTPDFEGAADRE